MAAPPRAAIGQSANEGRAADAKRSHCDAPLAVESLGERNPKPAVPAKVRLYNTHFDLVHDGTVEHRHIVPGSRPLPAQDENEATLLIIRVGTQGDRHESLSCYHLKAYSVRVCLLAGQRIEFAGDFDRGAIRPAFIAIDCHGVDEAAQRLCGRLFWLRLPNGSSADDLGPASCRAPERVDISRVRGKALS
jgi:hypothetical protein